MIHVWSTRRGHLASAVLLAVACLVACRRGAGDLPAKPLDTSCRVDDDCTVDDGLGCCGYRCGDPPPWSAVNRRDYERASTAMRRACEDRDEKCPMASCPKWPDCRTEPKAYCRAGRCAVRVVTTEACGSACPSSCGSEPVPVSADLECVQAAHDAWALCCCRAGGAEPICHELADHACNSARGCALATDAGVVMPAGCEPPAR